MDLRRLRVGEWLMAVAGVVLLVAVFLHGDFGVASLLLVVLALAAIAVPPLVASAQTAAPGVASETLVLLGCIVGIVVALAVGWWGAVAAVAAVAVTTLIAMRDERLSTTDRLTDSTGVPVNTAPEPEQLPAPPA